MTFQFYLDWNWVDWICSATLITDSGPGSFSMCSVCSFSVQCVACVVSVCIVCSCVHTAGAVCVG